MELVNSDSNKLFVGGPGPNGELPSSDVRASQFRICSRGVSYESYEKSMRPGVALTGPLPTVAGGGGTVASFGNCCRSGKQEEYPVSTYLQGKEVLLHHLESSMTPSAPAGSAEDRTRQSDRADCSPSAEIHP